MDHKLGQVLAMLAAFRVPSTGAYGCFCSKRFRPIPKLSDSVSLSVRPYPVGLRAVVGETTLAKKKIGI